MKAFSKFLDSISDIEMALSMYLAAGASITSGKWSNLIGQLCLNLEYTITENVLVNSAGYCF